MSICIIIVTLTLVCVWAAAPPVDPDEAFGAIYGLDVREVRMMGAAERQFWVKLREEEQRVTLEAARGELHAAAREFGAEGERVSQRGAGGRGVGCGEGERRGQGRARGGVRGG